MVGGLSACNAPGEVLNGLSPSSPPGTISSEDGKFIVLLQHELVERMHTRFGDAHNDLDPVTPACQVVEIELDGERHAGQEGAQLFNCHRFFMENPSLSGRGSVGAKDVPKLTHTKD